MLNLLLFGSSINIVRVTKTAVNIEHIIPVLNVIAKPLIGPEPILAKTKAAIKVVTFASSMVTKALLYPDSIAE